MYRFGFKDYNNTVMDEIGLPSIDFSLRGVYDNMKSQQKVSTKTLTKTLTKSSTPKSKSTSTTESKTTKTIMKKETVPSRKSKQCKKKTQTDESEYTDSEIEIDEDNNQDSLDDTEEQDKDGDDSQEKEDTKPPVYDGTEPYYIFIRRWNAYMAAKQSKQLHSLVLEFLNKLLDKEYKSLISIKKIPIDSIPDTKVLSELIKSNDAYSKAFKLRCGDKPSHKVIDTLLSKINFSLVEVEDKNKRYYSIKHKVYTDNRL